MLAQGANRNAEPDKLESSQEQIIMPRGFKVETGAGHYRLIETWFRGASVILTILSAFWNVGLIFYFLKLLQAQRLPVLAILVFIPFALIGLCLLYWSAAAILNRTYYEISVDEFRIRHQPIPWFGACQLRPSAIQQIYLKELEEKTKHGEPIYALRALMLNGDAIDLIPGETDKARGLFLETVLERQLGIVNQAIKGGVDR